jgi:ABC-type Mn2+/Zn2+ transport system permease subunit/Mn-dependent DtxR family transcriptional regulator
MSQLHPVSRGSVSRAKLVRASLSRMWSLAIAAITLLLLPAAVNAARIGDIVESSAYDQAVRFFTFRDPSLRLALIGSLLLGVSCGMLGAFLVVRRMALLGDTLSHAVLPGVAVGFLWKMTKDPVWIFIGATCAGILGTLVIGWLVRTTKLKEDSALGIVLSVFFAIGICLMGVIQRLPGAGKSGIGSVFFGQAAALSGGDVSLMAGTTAATVLLLTLFYKEFLATSFDAVFARTIGMPVRLLHNLLMLLLTASVVVALQAVGAVLVSAMLIIPAATAYLLADRMHRMLLLSALLGMLAGALGAFVSFLGSNLPTGPCMVLAASSIFAVTFLFAPRHGVLARTWHRRERRRRVARENTLKAIYQVLEAGGFKRDSITLNELAERRRTSETGAQREVAALSRHGLATSDAELRLTTEGTRVARTVIRNHRLWELYLTERANFRTDHVHDDAEEIEHVLDEETVRMLEQRLDFPQRDPHGREIPRPT